MLQQCLDQRDQLVMIESDIRGTEGEKKLYNYHY